MNQTLIRKLETVDTPTVSNAIETVQGRRGFAAFTRQTMFSSAPDRSRMVGYARTARIAASEPPTDPPDLVRRRRLDYFRFMSKAPMPAIAVIEDLDFPYSVGAFWGEINATVHKGLGFTGAITNGLMRDLDDLPDDFPITAGGIGPSHGFVHVRDFGTPVTICGLEVTDGDLVHADRHGAIVIPVEVFDGLGAAIDDLLAAENLVLDPARRDDFDYAMLERAWTAYEAART